MAHFAELDETNIVKQVIVVNNEVIENKDFPQSESIGIAFCKSIFGEDTNWVQTSYNGNFRVRYAGIEMTYDSARDAFIAPKPSEGSYVLNEETLSWDEVN
jgi:hypothetical protein